MRTGVAIGLISLVTLVGMACGGGTGPVTDAATPDVTRLTEGARPGDTGGKVESGTTACGTCAPGLVCVHPCCGGVPPQCLHRLDSGACPPGTQAGYCFGGSGECQLPPCTPPPPYCGAPPQGCTVQPGGQEAICVCA
jgi:hypothetical protein